MSDSKITVNVPEIKTIALVAHDNRKKDLLEWVDANREILGNHCLIGTGTTGSLVSEMTGLNVTSYKSGPLGGDQQIGALACEGKVDIIIFFWDPMTAQPHDPDVKALLRLSVLYNIPTACNVSTANFMISSEYFHQSYQKVLVDYNQKRPEVLIA